MYLSQGLSKNQFAQIHACNSGFASCVGIPFAIFVILSLMQNSSLKIEAWDEISLTKGR